MYQKPNTAFFKLEINAKIIKREERILSQEKSQVKF